jgi:hypothetical protein
VIIVSARPRFHFTSQDDWTEIHVEGDCEESLANIITATLLASRYEVKQLGEESDEPEVFGDYLGEAS